MIQGSSLCLGHVSAAFACHKVVLGCLGRGLLPGLQAYTAEAWGAVYECDELEASAWVALCSAEAIQVNCTQSDCHLHLAALTCLPEGCTNLVCVFCPLYNT